MIKKKGYKTKSLKRQLAQYNENHVMQARINGRIKGLKGA